MDGLHFIYPFLNGPDLQVDLYADPEDAEPLAGASFSLEFLVDELFTQVANEDGVITAEDDREYAEDIAHTLRAAADRITTALNKGRQ